MRALVTGATGKVGHAIASALLDRGDQVRALVRDPKRAASVLPAGVEPLQGDATDPESLAAAVDGCELVFNSMGMPEQWVKDESIFDQVNAIGSGQLAGAAKRAGVRRFIHTSTHDVFHADAGERFDETMLADYPKGTAYERSKQHAEELVLAERDGMEVVILNPAGVYGPTPVSHPLLRERGLRAGRPQAPPRRSTGRHRLRVRRGSRRRAPAGRREGQGRRALHPGRRVRRLSRARGDGEADRRPRSRATEDAGPGRQGGSQSGRGPLALDETATAAAQGPAHLHPLAGPPGLLEGAAGVWLEDHTPR